MGVSQPTLLSSLKSAIYAFFRRLLLWILCAGPIPAHIALIMDGNRRFADRCRLDRKIGHLYGYDSLMKTLEDCLDLGVKVVTVYAFSIDNFKRSPEEVASLMELMQDKLETLVGKESLVRDYGIQVRVLGDLSLLPEGVRNAAERAMAVTRNNKAAVLNLCVAYTSTQEILRSIEKIRDGVVFRASCGSCLRKTEYRGTGGKFSDDERKTDDWSSQEGKNARESSPMFSKRKLSSETDQAITSLKQKAFENWVDNREDDVASRDLFLKGEIQGAKPEFLPSSKDEIEANGYSVCGNGSFQKKLRCAMNGSTHLEELKENGSTTAKKKISRKRNGLTHAWEPKSNEIKVKDQKSTLMGCDDSSDGGCKPKDGDGIYANRTNGVADVEPLAEAGSRLGEGHTFKFKALNGETCREGVRGDGKMDHSEIVSSKRNGLVLNKEDNSSHGFPAEELVDAVLDSVTEQKIEHYLYTSPCPPPDLLIRTSGETRLSNFLLWQTSFSHLAFCKVLWPEFSLRHLFFVILEYQRAYPHLLEKRRLCNQILSQS